MQATDPHASGRLATAGRGLDRAEAAMILVHGRGATAEDILSLADELGEPRFAYLAPQAAGNTWYPYSFLAPLAANEPGRSSGLGVLDALLGRLEAQGIPSERVILLDTEELEHTRELMARVLDTPSTSAHDRISKP